MTTYEKYITVAIEDLDNLNHVNNVRYVQWVQDIAEEHWKSKTSQKILNTYFWVLIKHHIEYKNPAVMNDDLKLVTYVEKSEGVTSIRKVDILNNKTNKLLVTSETTWCLMNYETKRPTRITQEIVDLFN
jgi:acyl-CoA thioester hydrolase